jgi:hypothetical protein
MPPTTRDDPHDRPPQAQRTDPSFEVPEPDLAESQADERPEPAGGDLETPEADASEQRQPLVEEADELPQTVPDEVNPADRVEQERDVALDEDEYRP